MTNRLTDQQRIDTAIEIEGDIENLIQRYLGTDNLNDVNDEMVKVIAILTDNYPEEIPGL